MTYLFGFLLFINCIVVRKCSLYNLLAFGMCGSFLVDQDVIQYKVYGIQSVIHIINSSFQLRIYTLIMFASVT